MRRSVEMRAEGDTFFGDFAEFAEAEDLEAAGIRENGARPGHETVKAAELADSFDAGAQVKVIGVAEENLDTQFFEDILRHSLYRGLCADRHEHRGLNGPMGGVQATTAGCAAGLGYFEGERHEGRF